MTSTSLTPIMLSVPPVCGLPVPGFSPACPLVVVADDVCDDDGVLFVLLGELLHAAASTVTATALATAPTARKRKCLTTLLLLLRISAKIIREVRPPGTCRAVAPCATTAGRSPLGHAEP